MPSLKTTKNGCFHAHDNLFEVPGVEGVPVLLDLEAGRVEVVADEVHVDLKLIKQVSRWRKVHEKTFNHLIQAIMCSLNYFQLYLKFIFEIIKFVFGTRVFTNVDVIKTENIRKTI